MKAPDKCYITREKNGVVYSLSFNDNGGLEYIRKDAVLEWAKGKWLSLRNGTISDQIKSSAFEEIMDKLNSL